MTRREFVSTGALLPALPHFARAVTGAKITKIETVYWKSREDAPFWPHWTWVRLHTDAGVYGTGETYPRNELEAAAIHQLGRPLLGRDTIDTELFWRETYRTIDFQVMGGAEIRALSALDLALWDLLGKLLNTPVYRLIGGKTNPRVRLYNTCFPHRYSFLTDPDKIMRELIGEHGIRGIKIWPFDGAAKETGGQYITSTQIDDALKPVRKLRDQFGAGIEIALEFHSLWNLTSAVRIAKSVEAYHPMWLEDMLLPGNFESYRELAQSTAAPLIAGERIAGKLQFQSLLESRAAKYLEFDACWCGGLTEARKITAMADAYQIPFAPHTAGGPLLFYAATHLSTAMPNLWIQESCQRFYESDWPRMLEEPLRPKDGHIQVPEAPGFGMTIKADVWNDRNAIRRVSDL